MKVLVFKLEVSMCHELTSSINVRCVFGSLCSLGSSYVTSYRNFF